MRIGIIGTGGIAINAHIPNYIKAGADVVAVANRSIDKGKKCAEQYNIPHVYSDYRKMLEEVQLDAISICTPNAFHARQVIDSIEAGCHVLCEKPPAITVDEAIQMEQAATKHQKFLMYGFHFRYKPETALLKKMIFANELGDIYAATVYALRRRGIPGWGVFTNKELQGGGSLIDVGVHMIDLALYLMGYPDVKDVVGSTYQKIGNRKGVGLMGEWNHTEFKVEDMARGMIRLKNGASILLDTSFAANMEQNQHMNVHLYGDNGGAELFPLKIFQEKYESLFDVTPAYLQANDPYEEQINYFLQSIRSDNISFNHAREGVILQQIVNGLYESAETGKCIEID